MVREHLAEMVDQGLVTPTGLISHGRGEAFDYLMGERTIPPALEAEKAAAFRDHIASLEAYFKGIRYPLMQENEFRENRTC